MALYWNEKTNGRVLYDAGVEYVDWDIVAVEAYVCTADVERQVTSWYATVGTGIYGGPADGYFFVDVDVTGCTAIEVTFKAWTTNPLRKSSLKIGIHSTNPSLDAEFNDFECIPDDSADEPVDYRIGTLDITSFTGIQRIQVGAWIMPGSAYVTYRVSKVRLLGLANDLHRVR